MSDVDQLFANFGVNPFAGSLVNATPQEHAAYDIVGNPQPQGWIQDGVIDVAAFAATIRPVVLVHGLPALPDTSYPVGQFVYNLDDAPARLYKNVADAWVAAVGADDIQANSITAGQIAAGAIGTSELAVTLVLPGSLANEAGGSPGVFIDSTGILIRSGKLTLQDEFGLTSMTSTGFTGSWSDFIALGLYNARFKAGTAGTVANGRTSALPFWTVADGVGSPTLTFLGPGIKTTFAALSNAKNATSDYVPVLAGRSYTFGVSYRANVVAGSTLRIALVIYWLLSDGSTTSTTVDSVSLTASVAANATLTNSLVAPDTAVSVKMQITMAEDVGHNASNSLSIFAAWAQPAYEAAAHPKAWDLALGGSASSSATVLTVYQGTSAGHRAIEAWGSASHTAPWFRVTEEGANPAILFGPSTGAGLDTRLYWNAASALVLDDGSGGPAALTITGALAASSTRPASATYQFIAAPMNTGTGTQTLNLAAVAGSQVRMPYAGRIVAVSVNPSTGRTAGTMTAKATINGVAQAHLTPAADGTHTTGWQVSSAYASCDTFAAGDQLRAQVVTSGYTPTTGNVVVDITVVFDATA